ncbi:MAG: DUF362 domain-containing protein [Chloroflexota bacterium]
MKPNFGVPRSADTAVVTDPELVFALVDLLLDAGAKVAIGESCVTGFGLAEIWKVLDIPERARARGVDLVDLCQDTPVEVRVRDPLVVPSLRIARRALEADLIANVPKLKTHVETTVTIALKNLKGVLTGNEKARLHQLDTPVKAALEAAVVDLNTALPPTLNVVDGVLTMEGGGPLEGTPLSFGVLVAGVSTPVWQNADCVVEDTGRSGGRRVSSGWRQAPLVAASERFEETENRRGRPRSRLIVPPIAGRSSWRRTRMGSTRQLRARHRRRAESPGASHYRAC